MSDLPNWDVVRDMLLAFGNQSVPIIDSIEFHYDTFDKRDGTGAVCQTEHKPTGATIELRIS